MSLVGTAVFAVEIFMVWFPRAERKEGFRVQGIGP